MVFKIIELFAGAGGMALGSEKAGFKHLMLNEIDKNASSTLLKNRPSWNVINDSIDNLLEDAESKYSDVNVVAGGFPCQSFSYAGKRMGFEDARGTLFYSYAKFIEKTKPSVFVIENVKGLTTHDEGRTFSLIIKTMEDMGYQIKHKVLNAFDYGVAQKRERIFIVGFKSNEAFNKFEWPSQSKNKRVLKDILIDVPDSPGYKYPESKANIMKMVPPGGCWRDLPDDIAKKYMGGSYYLGGGKTGMARRLSWNEPSLTLTTSPMQKQTERCHPEEIRPFKIREYARIQSFPDNWDFVGSVSSIYRQIGNAVPVELAEKVFKAIKKALL